MTLGMNTGLKSRETRLLLSPQSNESQSDWNMKFKTILCLPLVLSAGLFSCSTTVKHPADLPLRYHNAQYGLTFFLPADWKGYSVLMQEWNADLHSADYQTVIGTEHGPIILLRNPNWKADELYQDIPIIVFARRQWDFAKPQRLFIGA